MYSVYIYCSLKHSSHANVWLKAQTKNTHQHDYIQHENHAKIKLNSIQHEIGDENGINLNCDLYCIVYYTLCILSSLSLSL